MLVRAHVHLLVGHVCFCCGACLCAAVVRSAAGGVLASACRSGVSSALAAVDVVPVDRGSDVRVQMLVGHVCHGARSCVAGVRLAARCVLASETFGSGVGVALATVDVVPVGRGRLRGGCFGS